MAKTYSKSDRVVATLSSKRDCRQPAAVLKKSLFVSLQNATGYIGRQFEGQKVGGREIEPGQEWEFEVVGVSNPGTSRQVVFLRPVKFIRVVRPRKLIPLLKVPHLSEEEFERLLTEISEASPLREQGQKWPTWRQGLCKALIKKLLEEAWKRAEIRWGDGSGIAYVTLPCEWGMERFEGGMEPSLHPSAQTVEHAFAGINDAIARINLDR